MPPWIRGVGVYGNGFVGVIFVLVALNGMAHGHAPVFIAFVLFAALAFFSCYVINKAARLTSEEEYLKAEVRKAELRKELAEFGKYAADGAPVEPQSATQTEPPATAGQPPTASTPTTVRAEAANIQTRWFWGTLIDRYGRVISRKNLWLAIGLSVAILIVFQLLATRH